MKNYKWIACTALILILGCSSGNDEDTEEKSAASTFLGTQFEAIEKAKGVNKTVQDGFDARDKEMDAQTQ